MGGDGKETGDTEGGDGGETGKTFETVVVSGRSFSKDNFSNEGVNLQLSWWGRVLLLAAYLCGVNAPAADKRIFSVDVSRGRRHRADPVSVAAKSHNYGLRPPRPFTFARWIAVANLVANQPLELRVCIFEQIVNLLRLGLVRMVGSSSATLHQLMEGSAKLSCHASFNMIDNIASRLKKRLHELIADD
eukprot:Platyproteum_vivax@DN8683_c0_g1_i1.p1